MTDALYMKDSYLKEFEAEVRSVKDDKFVVLDKTAFYPSSGGQMNDTGVMVRRSDKKEFKVVYVGKFSGQISHETEQAGLGQGDIVDCRIDWERRYKMMRSHTAAHIVSKIFHLKAGALITGNQLSLDKIRIDFSLEDFDKERISSYIDQANMVVEQDLPINAYSMPIEEVMKNPDMTKLAKGLPPGLKEVRIVAIGDFDRQADGGTHVRSTKEVGRIEFLKAENKGKSFRRVYFRLV